MNRLVYKIGIIKYDFRDIIDELVVHEARDEAAMIIRELIDQAESNHPMYSMKMIELIIYIERKHDYAINAQLSDIKRCLKKDRIYIEGKYFNFNF